VRHRRRRPRPCEAVEHQVSGIRCDADDALHQPFGLGRRERVEFWKKRLDFIFRNACAADLRVWPPRLRDLAVAGFRQESLDARLPIPVGAKPQSTIGFELLQLRLRYAPEVAYRRTFDYST